jgi:hypothetical protein
MHMMLVFSKLHKHGASVRFEVFTAVTVNNVVFWDVAPSTQRHIPEDDIVQDASVQ